MIKRTNQNGLRFVLGSTFERRGPRREMQLKRGTGTAASVRWKGARKIWNGAGRPKNPRENGETRIILCTGNKYGEKLIPYWHTYYVMSPLQLTEKLISNRINHEQRPW